MRSALSVYDVVQPILRVPVGAADLPVGIPIIGMDRPPKERWQIREAVGSAFALGGDVFLTAGHCLNDLGGAAEKGDFVIGYTVKTGHIRYAKIVEHEIIPQFDIGIMRTEHVVHSIRIHKWRAGPVLMGDDIQCYGFAAAWDSANEFMNPRCFRGHIVGHTKISNVPKRPFGLQLSFPAPRGLSGAPLLEVHGNRGGTRVIGVVLGTESLKTTVVSEFFECEESPTEKSTYREVEALRFGIAIHAKEVVDRESKLLGQTLGAFLRRSSLLAEEGPAVLLDDE